MASSSGPLTRDLKVPRSHRRQPSEFAAGVGWGGRSEVGRLVGVTARLVPDNLATGVTKADLYDPKLNRAYAEMAAYYGCL